MLVWNTHGRNRSPWSGRIADSFPAKSRHVCPRLCRSFINVVFIASAAWNLKQSSVSFSVSNPRPCGVVKLRTSYNFTITETLLVLCQGKRGWYVRLITYGLGRDKNEWGCTYAFTIRLHGVQRDSITFCFLLYMLLQLSFHLVALVLTVVQMQQIRINIHKWNNTKTV